jgi:hypothetical protein
VASAIASMQGGGQPLPRSERAFFERRFGKDFSHVRVHIGVRDSELASVMNARAFTLGREIVFGDGAYRPETAAGRRLLAHELTHVVQQTRSGSVIWNIHDGILQRNGPIGPIGPVLSPVQQTGPVEITAIDDRVEPWPWWALTKYAGPIGGFFRTHVSMTDTQDMVNNVLNQLNGRHISRLNVFDHGNTQFMQIGDDTLTAQNVGQYAPILSALQGNFAAGAFVHMENCEIGQNKALICALAAAYGVPVYAGTGYHSGAFRFNTGAYVRCDSNGAFQANVGRP